MDILVFMEDHHNEIFLGELGEHHKIERASREHDARRLIEEVARSARTCDLIVMVDERMAAFTLEQVRAHHEVGLPLENYGDYRETGVRLCEYARELGLLERGIPFVCGSILYERNIEMSDIGTRIEQAGGEFVPMRELKDAIRSHLR